MTVSSACPLDVSSLLRNVRERLRHGRKSAPRRIVTVSSAYPLDVSSLRRNVGERLGNGGKSAPRRIGTVSSLSVGQEFVCCATSGKGCESSGQLFLAAHSRRVSRWSQDARCAVSVCRSRTTA